MVLRIFSMGLGILHSLFRSIYPTVGTFSTKTDGNFTLSRNNFEHLNGTLLRYNECINFICTLYTCVCIKATESTPTASIYSMWEENRCKSEIMRRIKKTV